MSNANDTQIGGTHYQSTYQHWDFVELCLEGRYLEGCITKYVARWRKKNGLQDLQKAMHYLDKLIDRFTAPTRKTVPLVCGGWRGPKESPAHFCDVNNLLTHERYIIIELSRWGNYEDLMLIKSRIGKLILQEEERLSAVVHMDGSEPTAAYVNQ